MKNPRNPSLSSDPLIAEIRQIRQAIWEDDHRDLKLHMERLRAIERENADRVATPAEVQARVIDLSEGA